MIAPSLVQGSGGCPERCLSTRKCTSTTSDSHENHLKFWPIYQHHRFVSDSKCVRWGLCQYCGRWLHCFGKHRSVRCIRCNYRAHFECQMEVPDMCLVTEGLDMPIYSLGVHDLEPQSFGSFMFCNVCRGLVTPFRDKGLKCRVCSYIAHKKCLPLVHISCPPWKLERHVNGPLAHFWIEGNLSRACYICKKSFVPLMLYGYRCAYCSICCCPYCLPMIVHDFCEGGPLRMFRIEPTGVITNGSTDWKDWCIHAPSDVTPLIVFFSPKSGAGRKVHALLDGLVRYLNPLQVVILGSEGPLPILTLFQRSKVHYRILVAGGDGAVAWVLDTLDQLVGLEDWHPPTATIPCGTGNDLARILRWDLSLLRQPVSNIMYSLMSARDVNIDRWRLEVTDLKKQSTPVYKAFSNYFSIGLDAAISLEFHRMRNRNPDKVQSQLQNKLQYFKFGLRSLMRRAVEPLCDTLEVHVDGIKLPIAHNIHDIIVLNIPSWAGGCDLWGAKADNSMWKRQSCRDRIFEVVGLRDAVHIGIIQMGLAHGERLAQGSHITIAWRGERKLPMQIDGEPWEETYCSVSVSSWCRSRLLASSNPLHSTLK